MPAIPPILADGKLVSDFKIKSELFNSHFAAQCTPVKMQVHYQSLNIKLINVQILLQSMKITFF